MCQFGMLVADIENVDERLDIAESMNVKLIRASQNSLLHYKKPSWLMERCRERGFNLIYNLNYNGVNFNQGSPVPYPTDMLMYADMVKRAVDDLDTNVVKLCVIENEPTNPKFHVVNTDRYKRMMNVAIPIVNSRGMLVANGGNPNSGKARIMAYKWVLQTRGEDNAFSFAEKALTEPGQLNTAKWWNDPASVKRKPSADMMQKLNDEQALLDYYAQCDMDYMNFHWYEPLSFTFEEESPNGVMNTIYDWLFSIVGKPVFSNETGQHNESALLVESMLRKVASTGTDYNIWYNGSGSSAYKLTQESGAAYANTVKELAL